MHHLEIMAESMTGAVGSNGPHQLHSKSFPKRFSNKAYCFCIHSSLVGMPIHVQSCGFGESVRCSAVVLNQTEKWFRSHSEVYILWASRFMWEGASSPSCTHLYMCTLCLLVATLSFGVCATQTTIQCPYHLQTAPNKPAYLKFEILPWA